MPRRLLRFISNAFATMSLLAALLTAALWAAAALGATGVARATVWPTDGAAPEISARADRGSVSVCFRTPMAPDEMTELEWQTWAQSRGRLHTEFHLLGFRYLRGPIAMFGESPHGPAIKWADHWLVLGVPAPLALAALLAPPLWQLSWVLGRHRKTVDPL